ncbi:MAG TPA: diguanylate cyclase [Spirochaetota bacterium]|nr:diguanylate cyclase [Spirochaetota bacterium]HQP47862.1 diguanylate cyclase [Spirochaetota bacterium]
MNIFHNKIKTDIRMAVLVLLIAIVLISCVLFYVNYTHNKKEIEKNHINELNSQFIIITSIYSNMADSIYHLLINTERVKRILADGVASQDPHRKNMFRKRLFDELTPLYQKITAYNFRQLHFHECNNRSFLRFHRPEKYGDDLTGVRYSVEYANREKKPISGFEEGRIVNGYRYIYPLQYRNRHIGSVEISVSIKTVTSQLKQRFNIDTEFIILASQVTEKVFKSEISNYKLWPIDNRFVLDRAVSESCILKKHISAADKEKIRHALSENTERGTPFCLEIQSEGSSLLLTFLPIRNFTGNNVAYIFSISDNKKIHFQNMSFYMLSVALALLLIILIMFTIYYGISQKTIEDMVTNDFLTGVYTRRVSFEKLDVEFNRYIRYGNTVSVIMIDIDHFKNVNDTHGHSIGDIILKGVAEIIKSNIRINDVLGRYGGEEFILVLPETDTSGAVVVAENIRAAISSHEFHSVGTVTVSCGVAEIDSTLNTIEKLIDKADINLYKAKNEGRNRVVS